MSLIDLASLVLSPTATKEGKVYSAIPDTGEGDMTFTRGSAATRVNSAGLIEKERGNLLLQSNSFTTTWSKSTNITLTSGQSGYDGSSDAWEYDLSISGTFKAISQAISHSGVHTMSVYAKANTITKMSLRSLSGIDAIVIFDLSNGTMVVGSNAIEGKMVDVGSGWYRCSMTYNGSSQTTNYIYLNDISTATSGSIYIQDAMLNQGLVATDYIETTTSAVYEGITDDVPRVDYSGGGCPSLLLEPSRTNAFTSSEYFDNWILQTNVNLTHNAIESPEGLINGVKYNISSNSQRAIDQNVTLSNGNTYTFSLYVKAIVDTTIRVRDNIGGWSENIDVLAADGWQRITSTKTITSSSTQLGFFDNSGDSGDRFYFYGAMLEEGSYASSYIPTYSVSSTRVADSCSKTGISELIGQTEGTLYWEVDFGENDLTEYPAVFLYDGTSSNRILIQRRGNNQLLQYQVNAGGSNQVDIFSTSGVGAGKVKIAIAYKTNDFVLYLNGNQEASDTSGNTFSGAISQMSFENLRHDKTSSLILFPTRLTNDQLEELTK